MIVIGADTHKATHTAAAVRSQTGELIGDLTSPARKPGFAEMLGWARQLDAERVWAIEDCRHVSGGLERFLVDHGERVLRVPPKLMAGTRRSSRQRGKSDAIDATSVARAALREGVETLPAAHLDEDALEVKLLLAHHDNLVGDCTDDQRRLRWHLHDLWPELAIPAGGLGRMKWLDKVAGKLSRAEQSARVRVSRELVNQIRERTRRIAGLLEELVGLVAEICPQLTQLPGCGVLSAAKLIAETAGMDRFPTDAKFARIAGVAPIPASSGKTNRQRLDKGGNRQLNCAIHRIAVTQGRVHPPAQVYLARKQAEGKTRIEALRCLKRQLARVLWRTMRTPITPSLDLPHSKREKPQTANNRTAIAIAGLT